MLTQSLALILSPSSSCLALVWLALAACCSRSSQSEPRSAHEQLETDEGSPATGYRHGNDERRKGPSGDRAQADPGPGADRTQSAADQDCCRRAEEDHRER